jgi:SAM-dependent methyltransferase
MKSVDRHLEEMERNLASWKRKPLLQEVYRGFYQAITERINPSAPGLIVELGSGIGNLKSHLPSAICTDLFANPWLDLVCDAYAMPFADQALSHLILFDVFHHLRAPGAFLKEARRVLRGDGKILLFEPFISLASYPVYAWLHHEPVALEQPIDLRSDRPATDYYAAQGNATRVFFRHEAGSLLAGWNLTHAKAMSAFAYVLTGGYSKPALYPNACLPFLQACDRMLSRFPRLFAARCLVELTPIDAPDCG